MDSLDPEACYRAVAARDARFDGRFFTGVVSTGIYCRPVCPARTPLRRNVVFHPSAAAAEAAGLRACLRCRPESAPDLGAWRGSANTVSRALALIEAGALDAGDTEALADRLGVGERHLRRLFRQHLGAAPVSVAQTRRVLLAKTLIHETRLSMTEVAMASGFGSVRRFNETFQALYGRPPSSLRRAGAAAGPETGPETGLVTSAVVLRLAASAPYDGAGLMKGLAARGDRVIDGVWSRDLEPDIDGAGGEVSVRIVAADRIQAQVAISDLRRLPTVLARVRRVFDLAADPQAIRRDLGRDPALAPWVAARPGLRLPGLWADALDDAPSDRVPVGWGPDMLARAEAWRPWRAYAALHLDAAGLDAAALQDEKHHAA